MTDRPSEFCDDLSPPGDRCPVCGYRPNHHALTAPSLARQSAPATRSLTTESPSA